MATLNEAASVEVGVKEGEVTSTVDAVTTSETQSPAPVANVSDSNLEKVAESEKAEEPLASDPASSSNKDDDVMKTALNSLVQGKRHLLVKDLVHAIASLGEACRLLGEVKGEPCPESGEAHYYYGKALLEMARGELSVIDAPGGEQSGEEEDEDEEEEGDEEDEEEAKEGKAAEAEVLNGDKQGAAEEDISAESPKVEMETEAEAAPAPVTNGHVTNGDDSVIDEEKPSTSAGLVESGLDKEEDEPSNLELAWEVLEVAKLTYITLLEQAHTNVASVLDGKDELKTEALELSKNQKVLQDRLASTHLLLGEVATEGEQYSAAEEDFKTALNIYRDIEDPDSRKIAQSHFQLGLAYSFDKKFVEAIISFEKAAELIELRLSNLKTLSENKDSEEYKKLEEPEQEIQELEQILPEMKEKITDTKDAQRDSLKTQEEEKQEQEIILRNSPIKNPNAPVAKDISHLVRKKKKSGDEVHEHEPPRKKVCGGVLVDTASVEPMDDAQNEPDSSISIPATNGTTANGNGHAAHEDSAPTSTTVSE